jgi:peptidylglycine monooxygenase
MLRAALGADHYRIIRPWGELRGTGLVSDVAAMPNGDVLVLQRHDALADAPVPAVIRLGPDGAYKGVSSDDAIWDGHKMSVDQQGRVYLLDRDAHQLVVYDDQLRVTHRIGTLHGPAAPFNSPCDATWCPVTQRILVADGYAAALIHAVDANGMVTPLCGAAGTGPGQFITPHAIRTLDDGRIVVADRDNSRIQIFTPGGQWLHSITDLHKPMALAIRSNEIYVTDQVPRLSRFSADGRLLGRTRAVLNGAHGMCILANGDILLSEIAPRRLTRLVLEGA